MLGIIGGLSAESTISYYQMLHALQRTQHGGLASFPLLLASLDFAPIAAAQQRDDWEYCSRELLTAGKALERAGASGIVIASNLMHKLAETLSAELSIPLLHIVDAVGTALTARGISSLCLLGAKHTMQEPFYRERLAQHYSITAAPPELEDQEFIQNLIYAELCQGSLSPDSRARFHELLHRQLERHQAVLLACTELQLCLAGFPAPERCFDSTALHVQFAFEWCRGRDSGGSERGAAGPQSKAIAVGEV